MSTKKATKRALLTSILAICLCLVMLIGSTFAWFTDTASTGVNKIQAGNLDVQLLMKNSQTNAYDDISDSTTPIFGSYESEKAQNVNSDTLWEPGKTQVAYLAIKNNGNLDLKYQVQLKVTNPTDGKNLYEVMKYAIVPDAQDSVSSWDASKGLPVVAGAQVVSVANTGTATNPNGVVLNHGETHYFALLVHMDENAGNTYMGGKVEFDLTVLAAQLNSESDSFNNEYDKNAPYPTVVTGQDDLATAVADGKTNLSLTEGTYTLYNVNTDKTKNTTLTIEGAGADKTTFTAGDLSVTNANGEGSSDYSYENSDVTFKNMTINVGTGNYKGFVRAKSLYFENCTIVGRGSYWGVGTVVFKDCTFANNAGDYNIWTYAGTDFTFDGCVFESDTGKFVNAYKEQKVDSTLNFVNCEFKYTGTGTASKPAVCLKSYSNMIWNATFTSCISSAAIDSTTGSAFYSIESGMNAATTVTINGTVVWENGAKK